MTGGIERWAIVPFATNYECSTLGRIRRCVPGLNGQRYANRMMSQSLGLGGYPRVNLQIPGRTRHKFFTVHRVVLITFKGPPPPDRKLGAHGDGNRTNNRLDNLRWASNKENAADRVRHGNQNCGFSPSRSNLSQEQVDAIERLIARGAPMPILARAVGISCPSLMAAISGERCGL